MSLEVSLEGVQVRLRGTQEDLMSFPLVRISFVADTNDLLVVMAIKDSTGTPTSKLAPPLSGGVKLVKMGCHVFQSANVSCVALGSAGILPLLHCQPCLMLTKTYECFGSRGMHFVLQCVKQCELANIQFTRFYFHAPLALPPFKYLLNTALMKSCDSRNGRMA